MRSSQKLRGFTLIEALVALSIMAVMAAMSWQSVDALIRVQRANADTSSVLSTVQATVTQLELDLNALVETQTVEALEFDGKRLRLTRRLAAGENASGQDLVGGVRVVSWQVQRTAKGDALVRWQSPAVTTRAALQGAWQQAGTEAPERGVVTLAANSLAVFYFRKNAWVNPLSTNEVVNSDALVQQAQRVADAARRAAAGLAGGQFAPPPLVVASKLATVPDGLRVVIGLAQTAELGREGLSGSISKDWIRPQFAPGS